MKNESVIIAESENPDYTVCVTDNNHGHPLLEIYGDDERNPLYTVLVHDEHDCKRVVQNIYKFNLKYLGDDAQDDGAFDDNRQIKTQSSNDDEEDEIYEREDALIFAASDFLETLLEYNEYEVDAIYGEDFIKDVIDDFCEYLAKKHYISVYRPMLVTVDGVKVFCEFPYEDLCATSTQTSP